MTERTPVKGLLFPEGGGPSGESVEVRVTDRGLRLLCRGGVELDLPEADSRLSWGGADGCHVVVEGRPVEPFGPSPEVVEESRAHAGSGRPEGEPPVTLFVEDRSLLSWIRAEGPPRLAGKAAEMERRFRLGRKVWWALGAACALLVVLLAVELFRGAPLVVDAIVGLVPHSWEQRAGEALVGGYLAGEQVVESPEVSLALGKLTGPLVEALQDSPYRFRFTVVRDDDVNAFALPGGQIVVLTGLLEEADGPGEVAGVLAHEIQHVVLRHSFRGLIRQAGLVLTLTMLFGDTSGLAGLAGNLMASRHSREQEADADEHGARLLLRAGMPVEPMARFFEKLALRGGAAEEALAFLNTHPASAGRAEEIRRIAASEPGPAARATPPEIDWPALRAALERKP